MKFFAAPTCHHRPEVYGGMAEAEAAALFKEFSASGGDIAPINSRGADWVPELDDKKSVEAVAAEQLV